VNLASRAKSLQVCRVYIGSFNSTREISVDKNPNGRELFEAEQADLLRDLGEIPYRSCDRKVNPRRSLCFHTFGKVNEFVKRLRAFKIHILIVGELKKHMPTVFGKKSASNKVLGNLHEHFDHVILPHSFSGEE